MFNGPLNCAIGIFTVAGIASHLLSKTLNFSLKRQTLLWEDSYFLRKTALENHDCYTLDYYVLDFMSTRQKLR